LKLFRTGEDRQPPDIGIAVAIEIEIVFLGYATYSSIPIPIPISISNWNRVNSSYHLRRGQQGISG
jgi:hypothetical protein